MKNRTDKRHSVMRTELVPIADRLRYMQAFRLGAILLVGLLTAAAPHALVVPGIALAAASAGYALVAAASEAATRVVRGRSTTFFGAMLIVDGVYLAYASYATGGPASLIRYVILLHLIAVALLASYRTGLKLALWHSLLLVITFYAARAGMLHRSAAEGVGVGTPFQRLIEFSALFWLVAIATSTFAAVNERELRRRRYDLEALAAMAGRLETVSAPRDVAGIALDAIVDTFDFSRAVMIGWREEESPRVLAAHRTTGPQTRAPELTAGSVVTVASEERRTRLVRELDPGADAWLATLLPGARNLVVVPLAAEGPAFGALVVEQPGGIKARIERRVVSMLERFVSHAALALRNAWLLEQISLLATIDGLTGLANRTSFDETLERELARAARERYDVGLLMLDIDYFKRLNDEHGHRAGDEALRRLARELRVGCREFDTAARYGGEEFALVLPGSTPEETLAVAERLRAAVGEALREYAVTVSVGAATFPLDATAAEGLIQAADDALYDSKRTGRNRVTSAHRAAAAVTAPGGPESPTGSHDLASPGGL